MVSILRSVLGGFCLCVALLAFADEPTRLTASVRDANTGRPIIYGQTNLPDGSKLLVTLACRAIAYQGQDSVAVANGGFQTAVFTDKSNPIRASACTAEVVMSANSAQSASVREKIGARGEKLRGPLVRTDPRVGNSVRLLTSFNIVRQNGVNQKAKPPIAKAPIARSSGGSCPCRGSASCVGPRGGRYCITGSGRKSYR